jgi:hypothetical protein
MKRLLIATAALTAAFSLAPNLISQSQAASTGTHAASKTRSPMCDLAKNQRNPVAWNAQYGCLDTSQKSTKAYAQAPKTHATNKTRSSFCDLAKSQKNPVAWNAQYGCLSR